MNQSKVFMNKQEIRSAIVNVHCAVASLILPGPGERTIMPGAREVALARTKLEEADLWLGKALLLAPENDKL